ncbi:MAG: response regulator [Spirochaetales bacterium]|nr:response regulator [Spirochaetales bacterium]
MNKTGLLYIDDEYMNLLAFEAQFRRAYRVFCFGKVAEAFECLEKNEIQFVFSDQRMPKTLGTEFLSQVRERFPTVHRAVISGFTEDGAIKKGIEAGTVEAAFEKPYRIKEIEAYIREVSSGH